MASLDLTFKSFKSIAPKYLQGATAAYTDTELTDFEPWVENRFGDRIHLPLQFVSNKFRISVGDRSYTVALSYHFPELVRNPYVIYTTKGGQMEGKYGAENMTFRRLYEILCQRFNGGKYFIDEYFDESDWFLGENNTIKDQLSEVLEDVQEKLREYRETAGRWVPPKRDGSPDMRYNVSKAYMAGMGEMESSRIQLGLHDVSERIKQDIIQQLMLGQISLANPTLSDKTKEQKAAAGFPFPDSKFYASGQLIESISIDFYVWSE